MATTENPVQVTITPEKRTWRLNVETPKGAVPTLQAYGEKRNLDENGNMVGSPEQLPTVQRTINGALLSDTTQNKVTLVSGTEIFLAELTEAIPLFLDKFRTKDEADAAAAAEAARLAAQP